MQDIIDELIRFLKGDRMNIDIEEIRVAEKIPYAESKIAKKEKT